MILVGEKRLVMFEYDLGGEKPLVMFEYDFGRNKNDQ